MVPAESMTDFFPIDGFLLVVLNRFANLFFRYCLVSSLCRLLSLVLSVEPRRDSASVILLNSKRGLQLRFLACAVMINLQLRLPENTSPAIGNEIYTVCRNDGPQ